MSDDPRRAELRQYLTTLTSDVRQYAEYQAHTGADFIEIEAVQPTPVVKAQPPRPQRVATPPQPPPQQPARHRPSAQHDPAAQRPQRQSSAAATQSQGEALDQIRADMGECTRCKLSEGRTQIVFGVGHPTADLVIVGEGPGYHEDRTGEPFVGRAGQLLNRMLGSIGLDRRQVYICNVVKCRPPKNRDPEPDELATCSPFMQRQIEALQPKVIMTVGAFAARTVCGMEGSISLIRRDVRSYQGVPVVATYHPAYLLRTPRMKRTTWEDLLKVRQLLRAKDSADVQA